MAITEKLSEIASAIRVKQGYAADDFENHPIAFTNFASAIASIQQGGNFEDSIKTYVSNNQTKVSLNIEITTTCTEVVMNITMTPVNNLYTLIRTMTLGAPTINNSTTSSNGIRNTSPLVVGPWVSTTGVAISTLTNENWSQLGGTTFYGFGGLNVWSSSNNRGSGQTYIAIGSNNKDTEVTDYVLKNEIDSAKYEVTLRIGNAEIVNNKAKLPISVVIKAKDDIEIGEISIQKGFYYDNNMYYFMLARGTISDNDGNPISLSNGDTKTFQIDIEF